MPNVHVTPDPDGWRISAVLPTKAAAEAVRPPPAPRPMSTSRGAVTPTTST